MAGNRSFKDYVADRFYNEIFSVIQTYATDNCEDLDLRLYRVRIIGGSLLPGSPHTNNSPVSGILGLPSASKTFPPLFVITRII